MSALRRWTDRIAVVTGALLILVSLLLASWLEYRS